MSCSQRFQHVLTKISVMKVTEYWKVFLLDADTLVRRNIDEIFDQPAPRGFMRGDADHRPNEVREAHTYKFNQDGSLRGGINAGAVLLEPRVGRPSLQGTLRSRSQLTSLWPLRMWG